MAALAHNAVKQHVFVKTKSNNLRLHNQPAYMLHLFINGLARCRSVSRRIVRANYYPVRCNVYESPEEGAVNSFIVSDKPLFKCGPYCMVSWI